jgi:hypothetical protein
MAQYEQSVGVVVSLAPFGETCLANGTRIINLPTYFLEQFAKLAKVEKSGVHADQK